MTTAELREIADCYEAAIQDEETRSCWECLSSYGPGIDELRDALGPDAARVLADAIDALKRLEEWDVMNIPNSDGRYWREDVIAPIRARFAALGSGK